MKTHVFMFFLASIAGFCGAEPLAIVKPTANETVPLLTDAQKRWVKMPYRQRHIKFADENFRMKEMALPAEVVDGKPRQTSWPKTVELAWTGASNQVYTVAVTNLYNGREAVCCAVTGTTFRIDNLEIARTYRWTVSTEAEAATSTFQTEDCAPRLLRLPGVPNARDFGGWIGMDGRRVKQGRLIRTAGLNDNAGKRPDGEQVKGKVRFDEAGREEIMKAFRFKTDLDLRSPEETWGMTESPLGPSVRWVRIPSSSYEHSYKDNRGAFADAFKLLLDEQNYPVDFHCIAGQDRTGALAFFLGALLGVDTNSLYLDWEVTAFRNRYSYFRHDKLFDRLVQGVRHAYPADTVQQSVEKFVLALGFSHADIDKFRELMLEKK